MKQTTIPVTFQFRLIALASVLALLAVTGCRSAGGGGSNGFASVIIANHSPQDIAAATVQVFAAEGYRSGASAAGELVFERAACRATTISREGLIGAHYGAQTINRVRVKIAPLPNGAHELGCKAFMVTGGSDTFFQDEVPLAHIRRGPYQSLLDKVAKRLK